MNVLRKTVLRYVFIRTFTIKTTEIEREEVVAEKFKGRLPVLSHERRVQQQEALKELEGLKGRDALKEVLNGTKFLRRLSSWFHETKIIPIQPAACAIFFDISKDTRFLYTAEEKKACRMTVPDEHVWPTLTTGLQIEDVDVEVVHSPAPVQKKQTKRESPKKEVSPESPGPPAKDCSSLRPYRYPEFLDTMRLDVFGLTQLLKGDPRLAAHLSPELSKLVVAYLNGIEVCVGTPTHVQVMLSAITNVLAKVEKAPEGSTVRNLASRGLVRQIEELVDLAGRLGVPVSEAHQNKQHFNNFLKGK